MRLRNYILGLGLGLYLASGCSSLTGKKEGLTLDQPGQEISSKEPIKLEFKTHIMKPDEDLPLNVDMGHIEDNKGKKPIYLNIDNNGFIDMLIFSAPKPVLQFKLTNDPQVVQSFIGKTYEEGEEVPTIKVPTHNIHIGGTLEILIQNSPGEYTRTSIPYGSFGEGAMGKLNTRITRIGYLKNNEGELTDIFFANNQGIFYRTQIERVLEK